MKFQENFLTGLTTSHSASFRGDSESSTYERWWAIIIESKSLGIEVEMVYRVRDIQEAYYERQFKRIVHIAHTLCTFMVIYNNKYADKWRPFVLMLLHISPILLFLTAHDLLTVEFVLMARARSKDMMPANRYEIISG